MKMKLNRIIHLIEVFKPGAHSKRDV